MSSANHSLAVALISELIAADGLARQLLSGALPKGLELNQFSVLNHLSRQSDERTPAQLARIFNVTRGAMTNTLGKLERAGHIHIRPDWEDARSKRVRISNSGKTACDQATLALAPLLDRLSEQIGEDKLRSSLPLLRELRQNLAAV